MVAPGKDAFQGHWVHSHEEDSDEEMVFRPATYPFPPSRGRTSFELLADGSYVERSPGPVDVPVSARGRWSLENGRLVLNAGGERPSHSLEITAVDADRLAVRRPR